MNNEEAIEIIKFLIDRFMNIKDLKHDAEAMKTVLNYIEELEEKIKVCTDTGAKLIDTKFIKNNFIPKQKIRDKIEEWDKSIKWNNADDHYYAIKILKELLGE